MRLTKKAENNGLSAQDREIQKGWRKELKDIPKMEEIKWLQRYKDREIKEGDSNTRYYQAKVNGRRRKNRITALEHEGNSLRVTLNSWNMLLPITKPFLDKLTSPLLIWTFKRKNMI